MTVEPEYDARYLAGIALFNAGDYFAAHEVWEELWHDCPAPDRLFYQSLIQAAVALYHRSRGNQAGADRLCARGRGKIAGYPAVYRGLAVQEFWKQVEATLAIPPTPELLAGNVPRPQIDLRPASA